jgi:polar amino acid transport system permease protein
MSSIPTQTNDDLGAALPPPRSASATAWLRQVPWWLVGMALIGLFVTLLIISNETYRDIFLYLRDGVWVTLRVSFFAYILATIIGLVIGIIRSYPPDEKSGFGRVASYHIATFYLELFRGLPVLVVLLIITFVVIPRFIAFWNGLPLPDINQRAFGNDWRATVGLGLTYGAFLSEIFRAGIQSVGRGQREAAQAVGLRPWQVMRYVVLPQATRRVLPPLGNDLIAMIKDSSLVAILAVRDITQLSKLSAGQSFLYLETYLTAAFIYLTMTIIGSLLVQWLERYLGESSAH